MSILLALPLYRLTDANGVIIPSGRLYSFLTGTTTPAATYTTSALNVSHGDYVQANSTGLLPAIYLDPTVTYRFQVRATPYAAAVSGMDFDPVNAANASSISFTPGGTAPVTTTMQAKLRQYVSLSDKGTVADALSAFTSIFTDMDEGGYCFIDPGNWTLSGTATFVGDRLNLEGAAITASSIWFDPASTDVALEFNNPAAGGCVQSSIRKLMFSSNNSVTKTAIQLVNVANCQIEDIGISTGSWLGSGSIGIRTYGRQLVDINRATIACARPIVFSPNAAYATISTDHFSISRCELIGTSSSKPVIEFETGVVMSNTSLHRTAIVGGRDGVLWNDTTSTAASIHLHLADIRGEQGLSLTGSVSGATQANPCVITTTAAHGLAVGDAVGFASVGGMTQLNSNVYIVGTVPTSSSFSLLGIDSSAYGAYTSGGTFTSYGYLVRLETTGQSLRELLVENVRFGEDRNGIRLRNVMNIEFVNCTFNQTSNKKAVDITLVSSGRVKFEGCYLDGGIKITNGRPVSEPQSALTNHFSMEFVYEANATYENGVFTPGTTYEAGARHMTTWLSGKPFSLADTGQKTIALNTFCGTVMIINHTDGSSAIFSLNGVANTATKLTESAANLYVLDNALATASRVNVGYSSGFKILNNLGGTKTFSILMLGGLAT